MVTTVTNTLAVVTTVTNTLAMVTTVTNTLAMVTTVTNTLATVTRVTKGPNVHQLLCLHKCTRSVVLCRRARSSGHNFASY